MSEVAKKRDLMDACNGLIPSMDDVELNMLAVTLDAIIQNMLKRDLEVTNNE